MSIVPARHRRHRPAGQGRRRTVLLRLDEAELAALSSAAQRSGLTPSGYAAAAALAMARNATGPADARTRRLLLELQEARGQVRRFAVNVNQAVAALNSTGQAPIWLRTAVEGTARAVARLEAAAHAAERSLR